jgi:hypothetical protein
MQSWSVRSLKRATFVFLGGFECSTHRLADGRRLDLLTSTRHRELVDEDYARLRSIGITSCRDGISWVEAARPRGFDFRSVAPMVRAAARHRLAVIWDLLHFGWPDDVDVWSSSFCRLFAQYARAFAKWHREETDDPLLVAPINEISFLAWAGGDVQCMNPFERGRGPELKAQLVRATLEAIRSIRAVEPRARFLQPEPSIFVHPIAGETGVIGWDGSVERGQYETWDMLVGHAAPELGGDPSILDIVGINFYPHNQFTSDGTTVWRHDARYVPLSRMLLHVWERYRRPMIISETGTEGEDRAPWLRYVARQCLEALNHGCDLGGITLYPIVCHPGWVDDRHCENGLWDYADGAGQRPVYGPLLAEIQRLQAPLLRARREMLMRTRRDTENAAIGTGV